jgi:predicted permease
VRAWDIARSRVRSVVFRGTRESDLSEELQLHLERETERLQATGLSREEARFQALRLFGGVEQIKEQSRDARGTMFVDNLIRDTRYGVRRLVRDWRFTSAAVLILGLAIGANTAIFSVVNAVLFRDPPFADPDRLVDIYQNDPAGKPMIVIGYPFYQSMAEYTDIFATTMAASIPVPLRYLHDGGIRGGTVEFATATYLDVLGRRPSLGRWFDETEDRRGGPVVAVLGHQTWTRVFRADPSIVGRVVRIQGAPVTIVGVGPATLRGTLDVGLVTDFWVPMNRLRDLNPSTDPRDAKVVIAPLFVKARLREGATVPQAQAAMDVLSRRIEADYPDLFRGGSGEFALGKGITVIPTTDVRVHPQADLPMMALASLVLAIVGLVLAIACSNLATLLLVRGAARAKEVAVRLAIGGTRRQLVRHLLTESLLLSLGGGIAGCLLAWWGMRALQGVELPITVDLTLDYRVLAFALALSLVTGVVFGLAPALKATRLDLLSTLRDEGLQPIDHRRVTLKNALIVVQVAVSVLLLGGTSIFLQQLAGTRTPRVGYAVDGVAMLETDLRFAGYSGDAAANVYDEILRRIAAIPGVQAAALSYGRPLEAADAPMVVEGAAGEIGSPASMMWAGPGLFDTLRIPVLHGRVFDARDRSGTPSVAVITETVAREYFGAVDAVGRRFRRENEPSTWTEVIGVVRDTAGGSGASDDVLARRPRHFFRPFTQLGLQPTTIVARSSGPADALVGAMQRELRAVDVTLPVLTAQTMARDLDNARAPAKVLATFLGALGGLGLVLASIGLYAVVAFTVARRSREIGIRMALGARSQQVVWSIARGVAGLIAVGTGIGLGLTVLLMLAMRTSSGEANIGIGNMDVYRPTIDPVALLAIAAVTTVVGVAAAFVPGRRAARMNPLVALRHD